MPLPIESVLPDLTRALESSTGVVLQAPPGAGKTTRVPPALLDDAWLGGRRIVMLEPRRLATRAAADRMARQRGERAGETIGYRMRGDTRVSARTRIEVVTEGVLTRLIVDDPSLDGIGLLIFDEFHERSLNADLGLALALQSQAVLRPDLRILAMSATLDGTAVAGLLGDAPIVVCEGRSFEVETRYTGRVARRIEDAVAATVRDALHHEPGDVLVFLPGGGEIRRVELLLQDGGLPPGVTVTPLYGSLTQDAQDRAIAPSVAGRRKVVLATSIAQTSLTIDGIRVVVDSGLSRVPRFSPGSGMTRLETVRTSRASADQRRGRAGRTAPGVCYRMWSEAEEAGFLPRDAPEILEADLVPLALDLAAAGVQDAAELSWLDPPPAAAYSLARQLLTRLGALDGVGRPTARGRRMAALPLHPRLAHMLIEGERLGLASLACDIAALLQERDVLRPEAGAAAADLQLRLDLLAGRGSTDAVRRVRAESERLRRLMPGAVAAGSGTTGSAGLLLAFAYPDRIAQRRPGDSARYLLAGGAGAALPPGDALWREPYLVIADTDGRRPESRIYLAAAIDLGDVEEHFGDQITREALVEWNEDTGAMTAVSREQLGAIVLHEFPLRDPDSETVRTALLAALTARGAGNLPWNESAIRLRSRMAFLRGLDPAWPDFSDAALTRSLPLWLGPHLTGIRRLDDLRRVDLGALLLHSLRYDERSSLDTLAPTHIVVPSGSRVPVDYSDPTAPAIAVRLQEMFGLTETPRVGGGRVAVTVHLLSPAGHPVQVTRDLAGFWTSTYFDVRKDLKGRYPKHHWPDDPLLAEATRRAKPRGRGDR